MTRDVLPEALVWRDDGHVSDVVATAVADGQSDVVPALALAHLDDCAACLERTADAVALSVSIGEQLAAVDAWTASHTAAPDLESSGALTPASLPTPARFPTPALGVAVLVALVGTAPFALQAPEWMSAASRSLPVIVRGVRLSAPVVADRLAMGASIATAVIAATCLCMGWMVARSFSRGAAKGHAS